MPRKTVKKRDIIYNRADALSWVLHAMKNILGYEDIRKEVITFYYPTIKNSEHIKTFDAHIGDYNNNRDDYEDNYADKLDDLLDYCEDIMDLDDYVVFTATNIAEYRDVGKDTETHYQTFISDNKHKKLYSIDPALKPNNKIGVYTPQIALEEIMPFYEDNGYKTQFISLKNPAQTNDTGDNADVFCQSWSLYILIYVLQKSKNNDFKGIVVDIPKSQLDRYKLLLDFYKNIVTNIPSIKTVLNDEYVSELKLYKTTGYKNLCKLEASELLLSMIPEEI
jgi:hypothetical protein